MNKFRTLKVNDVKTRIVQLNQKLSDNESAVTKKKKKKKKYIMSVNICSECGALSKIWI